MESVQDMTQNYTFLSLIKYEKLVVVSSGISWEKATAQSPNKEYFLQRQQHQAAFLPSPSSSHGQKYVGKPIEILSGM
jgi:steroid 5-alpha reductase family enzyme